MIPKFFMTCGILYYCLPAIIAQPTTEEKAVRQVIIDLFEGMHRADSAGVRRLFHPEMRLMTLGADKSGLPVVQTADIQKFLNNLGTPRKEAPLDERIWSYKIQVDGRLASAWTPYSFYVGSQFSHCGTNTFQLVKMQGGWKILQITDTRQKENCRMGMPVKPEDLPKFLDEMISKWHRAAATADEDTFFGMMTPDAVYIGTDTTERWLRDTFRTWSAFAFEREVAWDFTASQRNVNLSKDGNTAWWDELLVTWMGPCRATGVLTDTAEGWKITHYQLSVTVPNDLIKPFIELTKPK
jgi:ketosteroid isomerase-like protein